MDGEISTEHVRHTLALVEDSMIDACIEALEKWEISTIQQLIDILKEKHIEARAFFEQLMYRLRDHMIEHINDPYFYIYSELLERLESAYARVRSIPDGMMLIEITLLRIVRRWGRIEDTPRESPRKISETPPSDTKILMKEIPSIKEKEKSSPKTEKEQIAVTPEVLPWTDAMTVSSTHFSYPTLINHLKSIDPALTMDLKSARFQVDDTTLILIFNKKWNYDRVNKIEKKNIITEGITTLFWEDHKIECKLVEESGGLKDIVHEVF